MHILGHSNDLFHHAMLKLHDPEFAEDLVQETFLAGLQAIRRFSGRSSVKTWLMGFLKNKIIDHFHQKDEELNFMASGRECNSRCHSW